MAEHRDRLLNHKDTAAHLGVSERTLERWRMEGHGPAFVRVGPRRLGYRESVLDAWTDSRTYGSRAAEMAKKPLHHAA